MALALGPCTIQPCCRRVLLNSSERLWNLIAAARPFKPRSQETAGFRVLGFLGFRVLAFGV